MPGHRNSGSTVGNMSSNRHGPAESKGLLDRKVNACPDLVNLFRGCIATGMPKTKEIPPDFDSFEISCPHPA
jgi:hypothetical protein